VEDGVKYMHAIESDLVFVKNCTGTARYNRSVKVGVISTPSTCRFIRNLIIGN
jgi:hypothetical protein